jgi:hypothetical protein
MNLRKDLPVFDSYHCACRRAQFEARKNKRKEEIEELKKLEEEYVKDETTTKESLSEKTENEVKVKEAKEGEIQT